MDTPLHTSIDSKDRITVKIIGALSRERLGDLRTAIAASSDTIRKMYEASGKQVRVLLDMSEFDGTYDVEALELMTAFAQHNADCVERTAGFSSVDTAIMVGEAVSAMARRDNIRFFPTEEEALDWLSQGGQ